MYESDQILCNSFENDDFYKLFLHKNVQKNVSLVISEQVKKLGEGIETISNELQKQVLSKHDDLLLQASHAAKLESVLNVMNTHVQCLLSNVERIRFQILGPYNNIETHTNVLSRLHRASHILRRVNRIQQLSKRLQATSDPVQQATILQELEQLALDSELDNVEAVSSELRAARSQRKKVIKLATSSLAQGISTRNVMQTTTALQIFTNLSLLDDAVNNIVEAAIIDCAESIKCSIDAANPSVIALKNKTTAKATTTNLSQEFRSRIWTGLEKTFTDEIFVHCKQMQFLQMIMSELNPEKANLFISNFWNSLNEEIAKELKKAPVYVEQIFEIEYAKLLKIYSEMVEKLNYSHYVHKSSVFHGWENSYLSKSLARLLEPVNTMFAFENSPTPEQIDSLIRNITSELSMSLVDVHLAEKIAKNVAKCIKMFGVKMENHSISGPEASQIIGAAPNMSQQLNMHLENNLHYLQVQINRMISNMGDMLQPIVISMIIESTQKLLPLYDTILQPLVESTNKTIDTIIVTIHMEPDWNRLQVSANKNVSCSPYMRELTQFITRVFSTYFKNFSNQDVLSTKCSDIALRCIELFVRHSSLLRPISPGGRVRLHTDYVFLESTLKVLCPHLSDLGRPYRLLKSMASIITLQPAEIMASQVVGSSVPLSTILFLLFSYAELELLSPHQSVGWSITKLSAWLDEHTAEAERLEIIAGALQRYVAIVRKKKSMNYDPIYPIITDLLQTSMK